MTAQSDDLWERFDTARAPELEQVGGKAASLIEMTRAGLPVPAGVVLTTDFFTPWLQELWATAEWDAFAASVTGDADDEELRQHAANLKNVCEHLPFSEQQRRQLDDVQPELADPVPPGPGVLAVRSSAPREDLAGASFAGVYESVLAVAPEDLAAAVRTVFASSLDFRVVSYKQQRGFDPLDVRIAVIVQRQVDSASAGVAFSLDPVANDYDHVVIQANRGVGETVVSGAVTPDQYTVDTATGRIVEVTVGAKETALYSQRAGGLAEERAESDGPDARRQALTGEQTRWIARMVRQVEQVISRACRHRVGLHFPRRAAVAAGPTGHHVFPAAGRIADRAERTASALHGQHPVGGGVAAAAVGAR